MAGLAGQSSRCVPGHRSEGNLWAWRRSPRGSGRRERRYRVSAAGPCPDRPRVLRARRGKLRSSRLHAFRRSSRRGHRSGKSRRLGVQQTRRAWRRFPRSRFRDSGHIRRNSRGTRTARTRTKTMIPAAKTKATRHRCSVSLNLFVFIGAPVYRRSRGRCRNQPERKQGGGKDRIGRCVEGRRR